MKKSSKNSSRSVIENIRHFRQLHNITAQELAKMIGISASYLSKIENEKIDLKVKILARISNALKINISHFLNSSDSNTTDAKLVINKKMKRLKRFDLDFDVENIRYFRILKNIPAQDFAKMLDMSGANYSKIETNFVSVKHDTLANISNLLGIPINNFYCNLDQNINKVSEILANENKTCMKNKLENDIIVTVGENIRYFRKLKNLSGHEMAKVLGLSGSFYSKTENAQTDLKVNSLITISNALGVHISRFFYSLEDNMEEMSAAFAKEPK